MDGEKTPTSFKSLQMWLDGETKMLFELYAQYMPEIGPMKQFKNKKDMWSKISFEICGKSAKQCEERYKTVMKRKKGAVDNNNASGSKRQNIEFEEELGKIVAINDSIEPEVQMRSQQCIKKEIIEEVITVNTRKNNATIQSTLMEIAKITEEGSPNSFKTVQMWLDGETKMLLELYAQYMPEIGPMKQFKNKKDMWSKISSEICGKSAKQCEERYKTVMKRKKGAVDNNNASGSKRQSIEFEEELGKIAEVNDSIDPEVQMSSQQCTKKEIIEEVITVNTRKNNATIQSTLMEIAKITEEGTPNSFKSLRMWLDEETKMLLDLYAEYMPEIGPMKQFKNKKDMWSKISSKICGKSAKQCEERYKTVMKRKKGAVDNNNASGSKRQSIEFEEELGKIAAINDSIEPEVQMSSQHCIKNEIIEEVITVNTRKNNAKVQSTLMEIANITEEGTPNSFKSLQMWLDEDTKMLLDLYAEYMPEIGPMKQFKNKKDMWSKISSEICGKSAKQCEERYKTVLKRKKGAADNNNASGSKRQSIEFEEELGKIAAINDSIEPEVQMRSQHCIKNEIIEEVITVNKRKNKATVQSTLMEIANITEEGTPNSFKSLQMWLDEETKMLLDLYAEYIPEIGPMKQFTNKKDMWSKISSEICGKSAKQCEERYKTVMKRKKGAVDNNYASGSKRQSIEFEEELGKIAAINDSIEPEVHMSSHHCIKKEIIEEVNTVNTRRNNATVQSTLMEIANITEEGTPNSFKSVQMWLDGETKMLLDLYAQYMPEIGAMKQFKNKKDMWSKISSEICGKSAKQCEERYKTVMKRKKNAVDNNNASGSKRQNIDFEEDCRAGVRATALAEIAMQKEANKERRHQERMKAADKIYSLLKRIVDQNAKTD